mgnify:CR=1 FL=1
MVKIHLILDKTENSHQIKKQVKIEDKQNTGDDEEADDDELFVCLNRLFGDTNTGKLD